MPDMLPRGPRAAGILPAFGSGAKLGSDRRTTMAVRPHLVGGSACTPPPPSARFGDDADGGGGGLARTTSDPSSKQTTDQTGDQPSGRHPGRNNVKNRGAGRLFGTLRIGPESGQWVIVGSSPYAFAIRLPLVVGGSKCSALCNQRLPPTDPCTLVLQS